MTAALAIAAIGSVLSLAIWALLAERRAGIATAHADVLAEQLKEQTANLASMTNDRDFQKERGDALDAALARAAAAAVGPVDGAFKRLLQEVAAARSAGGGDAAKLPDAGTAGAATEAGRRVGDGLLEPGQDP